MELTDLSAGYYSTLEHKRHPEDPTVVFLRKNYGEKNGGVPQEESRRLQYLMNRFDDIAESIGVQTARSVNFDESKHETPGHVILHEDVPFVGPDIQRLLSLEPPDSSNIIPLMEEVLAVHQKVFDADFPITLDAVYANFCLGENGIVYIDKMPPRQRLEDGTYLSEIPLPPSSSRQIVEDRHFTPLQARVIYTQGLRALTTHGPSPLATEYKGSMRKVLGDEVTKLIDLTDDEKERVLLLPTYDDIDTLRMIGWEMYHEGTVSLDAAKAAHKLSHIHYGGVLPDMAELQQAGSLLRASQEMSRVAASRNM